MPTPTRRRRSNGPTSASASASPLGSIEIAPVLQALGDRVSEPPAVLVRLLLIAVDEVTGEQRVVGSFLKQVSMPPDLASPRVKIALEIFGERHVFKPTDIVWDEPNQICIVEVEWVVAHAAGDVACTATSSAAR